MELRRSNRLHFIQAIKGGLLVKVLNVNYRGEPAITFKSVKDIYNTEDAKSCDSLPTFWLNEEIEGLRSDCNALTVENPYLFTVNRRTIEIEAEVSNCRENDDGRNSDVDDFSFGMTLKQIKERCKPKKRKLSEYADLTEKALESPVKPEYSNLLLDEDEYDLKKPLHCWKSKLSKNKKSKRKCTKKDFAISLHNAMAIVKPEQLPSDENFLQSCQNMPILVDVKSEFCEPDHLDIQGATCDTSNLSFGHEEQVESCTSKSEMPDKADEYFAPILDSTFPDKESQYCVVNEVSYEYMKFGDTDHALDTDVGGAKDIIVSSPEIATNQYPESFELQPKEVGKIIDHLPPKETISLCSFIITYPHNADIYEDSNCTPMHEMPWMTASNSQIPSPEVADSQRVMCVGPSDRGSPSPTKEGAKDVSPSPPETNTLSCCSDCTSSCNCISWIPCNDGSPLATEKQPVMSACADAATTVSKALHPCNSTYKLEKSAEIGDYSHSKLQNPPGRLLSTRKVISPTSQERLCRTMESIKLQDNESYKCRGKLFFGKQTDKKVSRIEGYGNRTCDSKSSHPKGSPKDSHLSCVIPPMSTGCASIETCSESAIAFSQQQMRDMECLANKLTKELRSMKDIVKGTMPSEGSPIASFKPNSNKVREAVEKATKLEGSARRWLSMMARDCNRFCKIMRLTGKGSAVSEVVANKERKKITFADEAGGNLCSVKVFEDDTVASSLGCSSDEQ